MKRNGSTRMTINLLLYPFFLMIVSRHRHQLRNDPFCRKALLLLMSGKIVSAPPPVRLSGWSPNTLSGGIGCSIIDHPLAQLALIQRVGA
jgi:hypothetical protein